jgi:hypothetical protein
VSLRHSLRQVRDFTLLIGVVLLCWSAVVSPFVRWSESAAVLSDPLWLAACVHAWQVCPGHCLAMVGLVLPLAPGLVLVCEATRATAVCACLLLDAGWLVRLCSC